MLNLYFGNFKDALLSGNSYFDLNIDESCIETDFGRRIIKEISGADVLDKNSVIHPIYGSIPTRDLAGGIKALFILMFDDDYGMLDLASMGDNCLKYLGEIAGEKDIKVCTDTWREVWAGQPIKILNDNTIANSADELYREWVKYLGREV
ncbi:MAG: DUF4869 domain-containing protein [Lachnospiraceae bacterium]|nr:DUF4869 domain-containing protein [Lachnospiraceae bacterium]